MKRADINEAILYLAKVIRKEQGYLISMQDKPNVPLLVKMLAYDMFIYGLNYTENIEILKRYRLLQDYARTLEQKGFVELEYETNQ